MKAVINLTYNSPSIDFSNSANYYFDGKINIKQTLLTIKKLLNSNIKVIDHLIENVNSLDTIKLLSENKDFIEINTNDSFFFENALKNNIINDEIVISDNVPAINDIVDNDIVKYENAVSNLFLVDESNIFSQTFELDVDNSENIDIELDPISKQKIIKYINKCRSASIIRNNSKYKSDEDNESDYEYYDEYYDDYQDSTDDSGSDS